MSLRYKGMRVNAFGLPISQEYKSIGNLKYRPKREYLRSFSIVIKKDTPKNLLVIYDIPEGKKKERDWFRRQLKNFDFIMIQRSVWIGPPLAKNFLDYVKRIGLHSNFKTFKLAKSYNNRSPL